MKWLKRLINQATCEHSFTRHAIYGDQRLMLGRHEEFWCDKCGKIVGKLPADFHLAQDR